MKGNLAQINIGAVPKIISSGAQIYRVDTEGYNIHEANGFTKPFKNLQDAITYLENLDVNGSYVISLSKGTHITDVTEINISLSILGNDSKIIISDSLKPLKDFTISSCKVELNTTLEPFTAFSLEHPNTYIFNDITLINNNTLNRGFNILDSKEVIFNNLKFKGDLGHLIVTSKDITLNNPDVSIGRGISILQTAIDSKIFINGGNIVSSNVIITEGCLITKGTYFESNHTTPFMLIDSSLTVSNIVLNTPNTTESRGLEGKDITLNACDISIKGKGSIIVDTDGFLNMLRCNIKTESHSIVIGDKAEANITNSKVTSLNDIAIKYESMTSKLITHNSTLQSQGILPIISYDGGVEWGPRYNHSIIPDYNYTYLFGGNTDEIHFNDVYRTEDFEVWEKVTDLTLECKYAKAVKLNDIFYIISAGGNADEVYSTEDFTNIQFLGHIPYNPKKDYAISVYDNKVWVSGGKSLDSNNYYKDIWVYDGDSWTQSIDMPQVRANHQIVSTHNRVWIIGGDSNGTFLGDLTFCDREDPVGWYTVDANVSSRKNHNALFMDEEIIVFGGMDSQGIILDDFYSKSEGDLLYEGEYLNSIVMQGAWQPISNSSLAGSYYGRLYLVGGLSDKGSINTIITGVSDDVSNYRNWSKITISSEAEISSCVLKSEGNKLENIRLTSQATDFYAYERHVAQTGKGDYSDIQSAINALAQLKPSNDKRCVVYVHTGRYSLRSPIIMKSYIDVVGLDDHSVEIYSNSLDLVIFPEDIKDSSLSNVSLNINTGSYIIWDLDLAHIKIQGSSESYIKLEDIYITGGNLTHKPRDVFGIVMEGTGKVHINTLKDDSNYLQDKRPLLIKGNTDLTLIDPYIKGVLEVQEGTVDIYSGFIATVIGKVRMIGTRTEGVLSHPESLYNSCVIRNVDYDWLPPYADGVVESFGGIFIGCDIYGKYDAAIIKKSDDLMQCNNCNIISEGHVLNTQGFKGNLFNNCSLESKTKIPFLLTTSNSEVEIINSYIKTPDTVETTFNYSSCGPWAGRQNAFTLEYSGYYWLLGGEGASGSGKKYRDIYRSTDGLNWEFHSEFPYENCESFVTHNGYIYVLRVYDGYESETFNIYRTQDCINWEFVTDAPITAPKLDQSTTKTRLKFGTISYNGGLYVIGGQYQAGGPPGYINDVWFSTDDGYTWVRIKSEERGDNVLPSCYFNTIIYNNKMWVLGGRYPKGVQIYDSEVRNDIFTSTDGINWNQEDTPLWSPRTQSQVVTDSSNMYIIGGLFNSQTPLNDVYSFDGTYWSLIVSEAPWDKRGGHNIIYNIDSQFIVTNGGQGGYQQTPYNDIWYSSDLIDWEIIAIPHNGVIIRNTVIKPGSKGVFCSNVYPFTEGAFYDNSASDLISNNVQSAIDELSNKKLDKNSISGSFTSQEGMVITVESGRIVSIM